MFLTDSLPLHDVLYIPNFKFNLLSVSKFTQLHHCSVIFQPRFCLFQDLKTGKTMGIGRMKGGLYHLDISSFHSSTSKPKPFFLSSASTHCNTLSFPSNLITCTVVHNDAWHKRLGHMSISRMYMLPFIDNKVSLSHYSICPQSKQVRTFFPKFTSSTSSAPFQLIHMDIWGPFNTPTYNGDRYFLTIVDDYSKETWVYLLQSKLDTMVMIRKFFSMVQTQFSTLIKTVRTDNALDFFKVECTIFSPLLF